MVGLHIKEGACGDVSLNGIKAASIIHWPKAIHEGNGKCIFIVEPSTTVAQIDALAKICTGQTRGLAATLSAMAGSVTVAEKCLRPPYARNPRRRSRCHRRHWPRR